MGLWLTNHARVRMAQRGISEAEIEAVLADPGRMDSDSDEDETVMLMTGKVGERILTIVYKNERVVTVRVANRKDRRRYGEQKIR